MNSAIAQNEFITTWKTDNPGTSNDNQITIPTTGIGYNYDIDWGDGTSDEAVEGSITHTYASPGTYEVSISGDFPRIYFNNEGDKDKILAVNQWGNIQWSSMERAFAYCSNLTVMATDMPDLSSVTTLKQMFLACTSLNSDFNHWDVSNITNTWGLFSGATIFNGNISNWNTSQVTNMLGMFSGATNFNGQIGNWDVSNVEDMSFMFWSAENFNQNIGSWQVGNVITMQSMFRDALVFNQNISNWDVSKVENMRAMFQNAREFNQKISGWNTSMVNDMNSMFSSALVFNQPLGSWDVSNVITMNAMFLNATDFNKNINSWNVSKVEDMNAMFQFAYDFNQSLDLWDVSGVTSMNSMFNLATLFNQNIGDWDISLVTDMGNMFNNSGLSTTNYDNIIKGWSALSVQPDVNLGATGINYCHSSAERDVLTNAPNNWIITDVGQECLPFVTTWKTDNLGPSADNQITIPTTGSGYNYDIDWGDGSSDTGVIGDITHTYASSGTYTVSISGEFPRIYFGGGGDKDKILTIEQWGDIEWKDMASAFFGCTNLTYNAVDAPNLSDVSSLYATFFDASSFNGDLGNWNVSTINTMQSLFGRTAFNQDISNWDVSNVTNLSQVFFDTPFNQDISYWDVSNVLTMQNLFGGNSAFNQDISNWDVSNVEFFASAFSNATSFNQDLSGWNVGSATDMENMFNNSGLSTINYDKILTGWSAQTVQSGVTFGASGVEYCLGAADRSTLETTYSWIITDAGENCLVNSPDENFLTALVNLGVDTDVSGDISYQEAAVVNNLQMAGQGISDLTGIEAFTALTTLNVNNNSITSIDVSYNTALTTLSAMANNITSVDLSNNTALESLTLNINPLGELDISNQPDLLNLNCRSCQLSTLDISANPALEVLVINSNNFSSIDLSNNGDLKTLNIQNNNLSILDISNNAMLESLTAFSNNITAIDLSNNINLVNVSIGINPITSLDFSSNILLADLSVSNCSLTSLDLAANSSLVELFAVDNDLTELNVANGNNSNFLEFQITGNSNLTCVTVDDIAFAEANFLDIDEVTNFSTDCNFIDIPDANFKDALLANTSINTNEDAFIQVAEAEAFNASLNVANSSIADLTGIEAFVNITALNASGNTAISSLDLSNNTELTNVQVQDCSLSEGVDLSMQTKLGFLSLSGNDLTELDLSQNVLLQDLRLNSNNLTSLDLSANPEIKFLRVSNNQLTSLNITGLSNLQQLFALNNDLSGSLDLSIYSDLTAVRIEQNNLSEIDLRNGNNTAITNFNATSNPNLSCISVDDVAYAEANFVNKDSQSLFSTNCSNVANDITAFSFVEQTVPATFGSGTIEIEVEVGTDLSNLSPTFTISDGASANPVSGVAQDFTESFVYTITAENPNAVQEWTVSVMEENVAPTDIALDNNIIDENNNLNAVIGTLSTTDGNTADSHTYTLIAGTGDSDNASFGISGGDLIALESYDFETKTEYSIRVQTDDGKGETFQKAFTISINNLEDAIQTISFEEVPNATYGDAAFDLNATCTSGLPVSFTSSNENVATIDGSTVTIVGAGSTDITALQSGNEDYGAAESIVRTFTVEKAGQTVTFSMQEAVSYGAEAIVLSAVASSELAVGFTSSDESVAIISEGNLNIVGVGTVEISAIQAGNSNYVAAEQSRQLIVNPAQLTVTADNNSSIYGAEFPEFTYSISGFVYDEDESVLETLPIAATDATNLSDVGEYTINISGGEAANYNFDYVSGVLTIEKSDQEITIESISDKFVDAADFEVMATTTSELELVYEVLSGPATISGNLVSLSGEIGIVEIEVSQAGNVNYNATTASISFEVIDPCLGFEANATVIQNVSCNGEANGSFEVSLTNGTAPFPFSLGDEDQENGQLENMNAGSYEIIVTDVNGCSAITTIEITEPALMEATATVIQNASCKGESDASFEVSTINGIAPFTYSIGNESQDNGLFENMATGNYEITVTDANGCSATTTVEITEPEAIEITAEITDSNSILGNGTISLTVTGGTGNYTYDWSNGDATANLSDLEIGEYSVTVTDEAGCSITESFTIGGVTANAEAVEFNIFPNPVFNQVEVVHGEKVHQITVIDATGQIIFQQKTKGKQTQLDLKALPAGMYFIRLDNGKMNRIIKQ